MYRLNHFLVYSSIMLNIFALFFLMSSLAIAENSVSEPLFVVIRLLPGIILFFAPAQFYVELKCRRFTLHLKCSLPMAIISYLYTLLTLWIKAGQFLAPKSLGLGHDMSSLQDTYLTKGLDLHVLGTQAEFGSSTSAGETRGRTVYEWKYFMSGRYLPMWHML